MLSFDNRPPRGPEDVHITKSGAKLLEAAVEYNAEWALTAYGRVAISEIVDAFDGEVDEQLLGTYRDSLYENAQSEFGRRVQNFGHGMKTGMHILNIEEVGL